MQVINFPLTEETREWIAHVDAALKGQHECIGKINESLIAFAEWMQATNDRIAELERKTDFIMKSLTFSQSSASSK